MNIFPDTQFRFRHQSVCNIVNDLKTRKIDLEFCKNIYKFDNYPEIESIPIKREDYILIVPKNHTLSNKSKVSLKDLKYKFFVEFCESNKNKIFSYSEFLGYIPKISIHPSEGSMLE